MNVCRCIFVGCKEPRHFHGLCKKHHEEIQEERIIAIAERTRPEKSTGMGDDEWDEFLDGWKVAAKELARKKFNSP